LRSPEDFAAQFLAHAAGRNSERLGMLFRPDVSAWMEICRYFTAYYLGTIWSGVMKGWMVIIPLLYLPAMIWFVRTRRQQEQSVGMFFVYAVSVAMGMMFLNCFKGNFYLIYIVPIYDTVLGS
jgi:hypothetical protein